MAENPYQPLPSGNAPTAIPADSGVPTDVGGTVSRAWALYMGDPVNLTLGVLGGTLLSAMPVIVASAMAYLAGHRPEHPQWQLYSAAASVLNLFWSPLIVAGLTRFLLTAARGEEPQFYQLFSEGQRYGAFLGYTLVMSGPATLIAATAGVLNAAGFLGYSLVFSVTQMGIGLILWIACALGPITAQYYIVDRGLGAIEALKASWNEAEPMRGHTFVVSLAMTVISAAGVLACGVGVCASVPTAMVMVAILYLQLRARQPSS